ncbi:MAG: hypothetical protein CME36_01820 [unclassified Hahellaceae]|nr:hypothetical protein [Hahellaceae bacterium]|tara:strand:+ start:74476 stop:75399 length:924 start_codon:yes stop_codon:yes gene_type:complete
MVAADFTRAGSTTTTPSSRRIVSVLRITTLVLACSLLSGCPTIYLAFEKHAGTFLVAVDGPQFVHIPDTDWDSRKNAMVYFYRPASRWSLEEIDAPSIFIDDRRYFSMRGSGFTWLEMAPGVRRVTVRRPIGLLLGFEGIGDFALSKPVDAEFEVEAGKVYYFRYSEIDKPSKRNPDLPPDSLLGEGDLQLVSGEVAFEEIVDTRLITNKPPLGKIDAPRSIVQLNIQDSFAKERQQLMAQREEELEELKAEGHWRPAPWYKPFASGSPTKRVEADKALRKLDKEVAEYERSLAASEKDDKKWYWPF